MHPNTLLYFWRAAGLLVADIASVVLIDTWISNHHRLYTFLALPLAFLALHASLMVLVIASLAARKVNESLFVSAVERLEPEFYLLASEHAYGDSQLPQIKKMFRAHPRVVEHLLVAFMPSLTGAARDRVGQLAVDLKILPKWKRMSRSFQFLRRKTAVASLASLPLSLSLDSLTRLLDDPEPDINVLAARALVQTGDPEIIERIFLSILDRSPLVRACVTEDLRKYSTILSQGAVTKALANCDEKRMGIVLEILGAWRRSLYLDDWKNIFENANPHNRISVLRLLPYIITPQQPETEVVQALNDADDCVRVAAATLVGQWQLNSALPLLSALLVEGKIEVAKAAAKALTSIGAFGRAVLENTILDVGGEPGRVALEALESAAIEA